MLSLSKSAPAIAAHDIQCGGEVFERATSPVGNLKSLGEFVDFSRERGEGRWGSEIGEGAVT
jgi:hypothetical protein